MGRLWSTQQDFATNYGVAIHGGGLSLGDKLIIDKHATQVKFTCGIAAKGGYIQKGVKYFGIPVARRGKPVDLYAPDLIVEVGYPTFSDERVPNYDPSFLAPAVNVTTLSNERVKVDTEAVTDSTDVMSRSRADLRRSLEALVRAGTVDDAFDASERILQRLTADTPANVVEEVLGTLARPDVQPWAKRAMLEVLSPESRHGLSDRLLEAVLANLSSTNEVDEYLHGCTISLRILPVPASNWGAIAALMCSQLRRLWDDARVGATLAHRICAQSLLVLGSFGDDRHIPIILDFIEMDRPKHKLVDHLMESTRRLLSFNPETVRASDVDRLCEKCRTLLSQWAAPDVVTHVDMFCRASRVIDALCGRLGPDELEVAFEAVVQSGFDSLRRSMQRSIAESERRLEANGFASWLGKTSATTCDVRHRLAEQR